MVSFWGLCFYSLLYIFPSGIHSQGIDGTELDVTQKSTVLFAKTKGRNLRSERKRIESPLYEKISFVL